MSADNYADQITQMKFDHIHKVEKADLPVDSHDEWMWLQTRMTCETLEQLEQLNRTMTKLLTVMEQIKLNTAPE